MQSEADAAGVIAGFDAGQTHTSCRLAEVGSGRILAEGEGPGVSHLATGEGPERFRQALQGSLGAACRHLESARDLLAAGIGASGIEQDSSVQRQGLELAARVLQLPQTRLVVTGDERTALRGAFPDGPGVVVISGTGTIAVGRDGRELDVSGDREPRRRSPPPLAGRHAQHRARWPC